MPDPRLHGPAKCPLRCSVCADGNHHWLEHGFDPDEDPDECLDADLRHALLDHDRAHGTEHALAFFACKHCSAWAEAEYVWELEEGEEEA